MTEMLRTGDAHVWYLWPNRIMNPERLKRHERILSEDEKTRIESFRFEQDRHIHLLTRAFVRTLLCQYTGVDAREWKFARNFYGKPEICSPQGQPPITFSIAHTAGLIACVFALQQAVGIDAENLQHSVNSMQIASDHFSPIEYSELGQMANSDRHRRFFEYWTLKEAYVKAQGLGMSMSLSNFAFHIEDQGVRISFAPGNTEDPASWEFCLLRPSDQYVVATAIRCTQPSNVNLVVRDGTYLML